MSTDEINPLKPGASTSVDGLGISSLCYAASRQCPYSRSISQ